MTSLLQAARAAKEASRALALLGDDAKSAALRAAARALRADAGKILAANRRDLAQAKMRAYPAALVDRLTLTAKRIEDMAHGLEEIAALPDPVGEVVAEWTNKDGVRIRKLRVPLGVVAMIYESRPNVTAESAALCLKAGNSVILRGGREAVHTNVALAASFSAAAKAAGLPKGAVSLIADPDRRNIYQLARMDAWIDLVIARGSEKMVRDIKRRASVPVLGHGKGVCHVYVDRAADLRMAEEIAFNAKVQRPGVCNAMETLLVHRDVAGKFLPAAGERYLQAGVALRGDPQTRKILPRAAKATERDWPAEYLDLTLAVKVVGSLEEAVAHINRYGSGHTDAIVTEDADAARAFLSAVDSAAVFHNLSTRLHDGSVFGLGSEIGISTQKLHARGTMGVRELTTTKYVALGRGQIRT